MSVYSVSHRGQIPPLTHSIAPPPPVTGTSNPIPQTLEPTSQAPIHTPEAHPQSAGHLDHHGCKKPDDNQPPLLSCISPIRGTLPVPRTTGASAGHLPAHSIAPPVTGTSEPTLRAKQRSPPPPAPPWPHRVARQRSAFCVQRASARSNGPLGSMVPCSSAGLSSSTGMGCASRESPGPIQVLVGIPL